MEAAGSEQAWVDAVELVRSGGTVVFFGGLPGEARPPVDQYAAAATLYNLLTGTCVHDFPADFQQRFLKILQDAPVPLRNRRPDVPAALAAVIHRALDRNPEQRYSDSAAFRDALLQVV